MGLFSSNSPFDADVEKATSEGNLTENWNLIIEICDKVGTSVQNAKDCLKSITKRLNHSDPHVVLHAITLLEACVKNCGSAFSLEVASRDFEQELSKLLRQKLHPKISERLRLLLKSWAEEEFVNDPQLSLIPSLYYKLKQEGMDFNVQPDPSNKGKKDSKFVDTNKLKQEEDDLKKAIELSLKESKQLPNAHPTGSSLYPSASNFVKPSQPAPPLRKVKALYDFEAAEDNELTFFAGEIFEVMDDSNPNWWKGQTQRGEGLFPANFVTTDLNAEPDVPTSSTKSTRKIAFDENVSVSVYKRESEVESAGVDATVEIDEARIDRLIHLMHEADPNDATHDTEEMLDLEDQVNAMGPLIDTELETVDKEHAQLTQLSTQLVEALNMYHTLMKEPLPAGIKQPGYPQGAGGYPQGGGGYPPHAPPQMYNGMSQPQQQYHGAPPQYMPGMPPPYNMPYPNSGPQAQIPNSMGPMYPGMAQQPPLHHYQPPPSSAGGPMSLPHNLPPHQMMPPSGQPHTSNLPQSPPMHHLPHQPHSLPNPMQQGMMSNQPQGHPMSSQHGPSQGQHIPSQGQHVPSQGQHGPSQGQHLPNQMPPPGQGQMPQHSHPNQLPHQQSLPNQSVPQSMGGPQHFMPPSAYPGPPQRHPMPPTHLPQL